MNDNIITFQKNDGFTKVIQNNSEIARIWANGKFGFTSMTRDARVANIRAMIKEEIRKSIPRGWIKFIFDDLIDF